MKKIKRYRSEDEKKAFNTKLMVLFVLMCILFVFICIIAGIFNPARGKSSSSSVEEINVGEVIYNNLKEAINKYAKVGDVAHNVSNVTSVNSSENNIYVSYLDNQNTYNYVCFSNVSISDIKESPSFYSKGEVTYKNKGNNYVEETIDLSSYAPNIVKKSGYILEESGFISFLGKRDNNEFVSVLELEYVFDSKTSQTHKLINTVNSSEVDYFALLNYIVLI